MSPGTPIKHVVVLMFENRSFDHMLGLLDHHPGLPPVTKHPLANPLDPANPSGPKYSPFALADYESLHYDPKHGYEDVMKQLTANVGPWRAPYSPTNTGFAWNYHEQRKGDGSEVMGCYPPKLLPAMTTLAREYAVCSRWFCSLPSETWPNRLFAHAGTSDNLVENDVRFYSNRTVFELLSKANPKRSWQIYAGDIPQVSAFRKLWWHDGGPRFSRLNEFFKHARENRLKSYSFIEPRHFGSAMSSQHPLGKVLLGEHLIRDVYEALTENPKPGIQRSCSSPTMSTGVSSIGSRPRLRFHHVLARRTRSTGSSSTSWAPVCPRSSYLPTSRKAQSMMRCMTTPRSSPRCASCSDSKTR